MRFGKVWVSPGFLLMGALLLYLNPQGLIWEILFAWGCHEAAHIAVLYMVGGGVRRFWLTVNGADIETEQRREMSYFGEVLSVLAGPGCNLLMATAFAQAGEAWYPAAGVQLVLGVFNLLPFPGLDGRRVLLLLKALIWRSV